MIKSIKVGPFNYRISVSLEELLRNNESHGDGNSKPFGMTVHAKELITIDPSQSEGMKRDTVLHEVLHACFFCVGLHNVVGFEDEEKIIASLSPMLLYVLRNNPDFVEYLMEGSDE